MSWSGLSSGLSSGLTWALSWVVSEVEAEAEEHDAQGGTDEDEEEQQPEEGYSSMGSQLCPYCFRDFPHVGLRPSSKFNLHLRKCVDRNQEERRLAAADAERDAAFAARARMDYGGDPVPVPRLFLRPTAVGTTATTPGRNVIRITDGEDDMMVAPAPAPPKKNVRTLTADGDDMDVAVAAHAPAPLAAATPTASATKKKKKKKARVEDEQLPTPLLPSLPPPLTELPEGVFLGVQGERNSCYVDTVVLVMFLMSGCADRWLLDMENKAPPSRIRDQLIEVVRTLRGPDVFVESSQVMHLRLLVDQELQRLNLRAYSDDVQDATDFLRLLFEHVLFVPQLLELKDDKGSVLQEHVLQVLVDPAEVAAILGIECVDVNALIGQLHPEPKLLSESMLVVQLPRLPKGQRNYLGIFPQPELHMTLVNNGLATLKLRAAICIDISHYVAYFCGGPNDQWYFYDSMSSRDDEQDFNVPLIRALPQDFMTVFSHPDDPPRFDSLSPDQRRFVRDAYILFYEKP